MRHLPALVLAVAARLAAGAGEGAADRLVDRQVDWGRRVVKCTGIGAPEARDAGVGAARLGAAPAARRDARRSCLEGLKAVLLRTGETVGDAIAGDASLRSAVEPAAKAFRQAGSPLYFSDGGVRIDVELPLDGELSEALLPQGRPRPAEPAEIPAFATGLLVDARGLRVSPALAPRILDEGGAELYGPALLGPGWRGHCGAAYARDPEVARRELAPRIGDRPLLVRARRARGADLVVGGRDVEVLRGGRSFLAQGRVVIVLD